MQTDCSSCDTVQYEQRFVGDVDPLCHCSLEARVLRKWRKSPHFPGLVVKCEVRVLNRFLWSMAVLTRVRNSCAARADKHCDALVSSYAILPPRSEQVRNIML